MDLNEMPEESFNAADMGADDTAYAPHKEGEEKDLTQDGGVKKLLVKAGEGWDRPETGDEVQGEILLDLERPNSNLPHSPADISWHS